MEKEKLPDEKQLLLSSSLAGWDWHDGSSIAGMIKVGKKLRLVREAGNIHDKNAVAIYFSNTKIGYIPKKDNAAVAQLLDQGLRSRLIAVVSNPESHPQQANQINFNIYKIN